MPSRLNSPSTEGEEEAETEVTKEEGEFQVTITQVNFTNNITKIRISKVTDNINRIKISILKEAEGEDQITNKTYNCITTKSMGTMDLNVERRKKINSWVEHMSQII
jgi:hypothetical protein